MIKLTSYLINDLLYRADILAYLMILFAYLKHFQGGKEFAKMII